MIQLLLACVFAAIILLSHASAERVLSDESRVTLWTIGPGDELYAAFGHSALRIVDPVVGLDRIYNFGTFDFATPNFYWKFIHGDLDYFLTAAITPELIEEYQAHHQLVIEQELDLTPLERDQLFLAMEKNLEPENAAYRYDFVRDNCTTRIRDAIARVVSIDWRAPKKTDRTLRQMVQPYVADCPSIKTGINLLFGANTDKIVTSQEAMFLPEEMKLAFDQATIRDGSRKLVAKTTILLDGARLPVPASNYLALITFTAALIALATICTQKIRWPRSLDILIFSGIAMAGCLVAFLWFGTRHWVLQNNWNFFWLWPTHLMVWFFAREFQRYYWSIYLVAVAICLVANFRFGWNSDQISIIGLQFLILLRACDLRRKFQPKFQPLAIDETGALR